MSLHPSTSSLIAFNTGTISAIISAAFGDFVHCPQTMAEVSNIVRAQCLGLPSCTPNFQVLGTDPCPGYVKWMDAAWECTSGGKVESSHPSATTQNCFHFHKGTFKVNSVACCCSRRSQRSPSGPLLRRFSDDGWWRRRV